MKPDSPAVGPLWGGQTSGRYYTGSGSELGQRSGIWESLAHRHREDGSWWVFPWLIRLLGLWCWVQLAEAQSGTCYAPDLRVKLTLFLSSPKPSWKHAEGPG